MNVTEMHEKLLYPLVRVRTDKAGGSGTVLYSQPDVRKPTEHLTFILTNWHVVEAAIAVKDVWDSLLRRHIKRDVLAEVIVETFAYHNLSNVISANSQRAEIVAYDQEHDLAVLRLLSPIRYEHCATLVPRQEIENLKLFTAICCIGCSLLHDPIPNFGYITSLREIIENKTYMLQSAHSIFGNSGGAVFTVEGGYLVGVPSRITAIQLGFGIDVITWMGFFAHPLRLHEFLREQELLFLLGEDDSYEAALERRRDKRERERYKMATIALDEASKEERRESSEPTEP